MKELVALFVTDKVDRRFLPNRFEAHQALHQVRVVSKLWVDNFDILLVLPEQHSHLVECLLQLLSERAHSLALGGAYSAN